MFQTVQPKPIIQSWSPWRKGWPRLIWSTFVTLYLLGLTFAIVALILVNPLTSGSSVYSSGTYTISGPLYQGNVFSGATKGDWIKTIRLYPDLDGRNIQNKALKCTRACHHTPGCHTFVIRADQCYLTSFSACRDAGKRYLLEWDGATTYEIRAGNDSELHQTCLARCLETKGCSGCGRPLCNGSQCENCPATCWDITPPKSGDVIVYPTLSFVQTVKCDNHWQRWWRDGETSVYAAILVRLLQVRVVIYYEQGFTVHSDFASFFYMHGKITVGKFLQGTAGNGWNAPFETREATSPPQSNCRLFFYPKGSCSAGGVMSYTDQKDMNATEMHYGYFWHTGDARLDYYNITSIELWIKPQNSST